jgi:hypothetical protein
MKIQKIYFLLLLLPFYNVKASVERQRQIQSLKNSMPAIQERKEQNEEKRSGPSSEASLNCTSSSSSTSTSYPAPATPHPIDPTHSSLIIERGGTGDLLGLGHNVNLSLKDLTLPITVPSSTALRLVGVGVAYNATAHMISSGIGLTNSTLLSLGIANVVNPEGAEEIYKQIGNKGKEYYQWLQKAKIQSYRDQAYYYYFASCAAGAHLWAKGQTRLAHCRSRITNSSLRIPSLQECTTYCSTTWHALPTARNLATRSRIAADNGYTIITHRLSDCRNRKKTTSSSSLATSSSSSSGAESKEEKHHINDPKKDI